MQLEGAYARSFPELKLMAESAADEASFLSAFERWLADRADSDAKDLFVRLVENEGATIREWSRGKTLTLHSLSHLHRFLRHEADPTHGNDLYLDLFMQLRRLTGRVHAPPSGKSMRQLVDRWPTGLDVAVAQVREENRERITHLLIEKVERGHSIRFRFPERSTYEEKYEQVKAWWSDVRF